MLDPSISKGSWTPDEDSRMLAAMMSTTPKSWSRLAQRMSRTDVQVRYRVYKMEQWLVMNGASKEWFL